ncbi:coat protein [Ceratocystis resinifera virus 1]|uniref:Coat protein n=1 Tax=Ceratocystis resinifera virus 1 TaxID=674982 RepID=Q5DM91_9VIRU|nr:coat protein [Ceratocystis resinifera virus 1]AAU26068.1 coat protein [Ceratocystis resinifera virus 1]
MSHDARDLQSEARQEARPSGLQPESPSLEPLGLNDPAARTKTGTSTGHGLTAPHAGTRSLGLPSKGEASLSTEASSLARDIDLGRNCSRSAGERPFLVQVVPDSRFACYVFTEYVQQNYSKFDVESSSMVSPATVVGYLMYCFHAFIFLTDVYSSSTMSAYAEEIDASHIMRKLIDIFSNCFVPDIVFSVLDALHPHKLDVRTTVSLFPSYGSVLFEFDAPRLIPPSIFLLAHNQLLTQTKIPNSYKSWLMQTCVTYQDVEFRVGNIIGGLYQIVLGHTTETFQYKTWLLRSLARLADSATHRTHLKRNAVTEIEFSPPVFTDKNFNPYTYMLMLSPSSRTTTTSFLTALSSSCQKYLNATRSLSSILATRSGSITRHMIFDLTAPTANSHTLTDLDETSVLKPGNFTNFCKAVGFCPPQVNPLPKKITLPYPPGVEAHPSLYLVTETDAESPLKPILPSYEDHVEGQILLFDPYDDEPSAHFSTLISGKLIENGNVDGITIFLPSPSSSIAAVNSRNLQGAIPMSRIQPSFDVMNFQQSPRSHAPPNRMFTMSVLYDAANIWLPYFNRTMYSALPILPYTANRNADGLIPSTNLVVTSSKTVSSSSSSPDVNLWWSYRYQPTNERPTTHTVYMYATLEPFFGSRSSYLQSYQLQVLLPIS